MEDIIEELKKVDLETASIDTISEMIGRFSKIAMFGIKISKGNYIARSRNSRLWENFMYPKNISYISDPKKIPKIGRANPESLSVFYGSIPFDLKEQNGNQMIAISEASNFLEIESCKEIEEYATLGKWRVVKDFTIIAIVSHQAYLNANKHLLSMHKDFSEFLSEFKDLSEDFKFVNEYISSEFAKKVTNEYQYKISAAFSGILYSKGIQGILYPSIKSEGQYFNIALLPFVVDNNLVYEKAGVWRLLKKNNNLTATPYLFSDKLNEEGKFIWKDTELPLRPASINKLLNKV